MESSTSSDSTDCRIHWADILRGYSSVLTLEEAYIGKGGLDSLILHYLNQHDVPVKFSGLGFRETFSFAIGSRDELHQSYGTGKAALITESP